MALRCVNLGTMVSRLSHTCMMKNRYKCDKLGTTVIPQTQCNSIACNSYQSEEMDTHEKELRQQTDIPFPPDNYGTGEGDGILYVGGGKYWYMIVAGIKLLRDTGCTLPIQVWYRGSCEQVEPSDVFGLNVDLIDADMVSEILGDNKIARGNVNHGGWESKLYAIYHCNFDRVLFLDGDAYCVSDPVPLFNILKSFAFAFWKDMDNQKGTIKWDKVNPDGKTLNLPPIQGGQLLFDKIKCWKLIHVANWICQNSDFYFKHMFGDQDSWRLALSICPVPLYQMGDAEWRDIAFVCSRDSKPYIVHRCQGKMYLQEDIPVGRNKYTNPHYKLPQEGKIFDLFAEVVNTRKRSSDFVFTETYQKKIWGIGSGAGTQLKESQLYIDVVNGLIKPGMHIVDVGCGDGLVSSYLTADFYTGYDCVSHIIHTCNSRYGGMHIVQGKKVERAYFCLDIYQKYDIMNSGDILLCKDVLHHWPTEWVVNWLDALIKSKRYKQIVLCNDTQQLGSDCHLGGFRGLNPKLYPLSRYAIDRVIQIHHKSLCILNGC